MDRIANPYAPGAGNPPAELAGRDALLEDARVMLARTKLGRHAPSQILVGLRGVGKTVLLRRIQKQAKAEQYLTTFLEAHEGRTLAQMLTPQLKELLFELSLIEKGKHMARRALRVLKGFASALNVEVEGVTYGLSIEPEPGIADTGDLEADLPRLMEVVAEASAAAEKPLALFVDELQYLDRSEFSALIMGVHRVSQSQLPLVLVAAGLPQTLALAGNSRSYAERLFQFPEVGALDTPDALRAIEGPAEALNVAYEAEAAEAIMAVTHRYPYFLQQWGFEAWNVAKGETITAKDIAVATKQAIAVLDGSFFKVRFDRCTPAERRYMRALAELGEGAHRSGDVANALKLKVTSLGPRRNDLIRKGMIYSPSHGDTAFTVPLFDQYMKRIMPELEA